MDNTPNGVHEYTGAWWDVQEPDEKWIGTVRIDPKESIDLTLTIMPPYSSRTLHPVICGQTTKGQRISLLRCIQTRSGRHADGPDSRSLHAGSAIVGFHVHQLEPAISTMAVSPPHIQTWWGRSGFEFSRPSASEHSIVYRTAEKVILCQREGIAVALRPVPSSSQSRHEATLTEAVYLSIVSATPRSLHEFERIAHACQDLLSIACLRLCHADTRTLIKLNVETEPTATLYFVPVHREKAARSLISSDCLFTFADIADDPQRVFGAWLSKADALLNARALYLSAVYAGGFLELRLLALCQAAEAIHRRLYGSERYMDDPEFTERVLKPLQNAIPEGLDPSFRQALHNRLKYAYEHSFASDSPRCLRHTSTRSLR